MRDILIVAVIRLAGLLLVLGAMEAVVGFLRPVFYPDGLPGVVVLGISLGVIMASTWWLIQTIWPVAEAIERRLHEKLTKLRRYD
jgi:hypothetical protein